jgi:hypothetical protein
LTIYNRKLGMTVKLSSFAISGAETKAETDDVTKVIIEVGGQLLEIESLKTGEIEISLSNKKGKKPAKNVFTDVKAIDSLNRENSTTTVSTPAIQSLKVRFSP